MLFIQIVRFWINWNHRIPANSVHSCGFSYHVSSIIHVVNSYRVHFSLWEKNILHNLALKSSYNCIGELPFTNFTPSFTDVIDYIWFSTHALRVRGLLGEVDPEYVSKFIGFPNDKFPSDHIPLLARFEFMKTNTGSRKV